PDFIEENKADLCASLQATIIDILMAKLIRASKDLGVKDIAIAGGVSANSGLRETVAREGEKRSWTTFIPELRFTTDNAAMIAIVGYYKYLGGEFAAMETSPVARVENLSRYEI
ncbi:MAG: tRNA (adenosine(37)-N6)-threonylcarbamoyltransferase complex transferase subunit TsaD, partial [Rikenellaceae bacterium]|nr:tRNA (adenosine(37)-N6)-threonylcarbamoyltransferase complex transferase subunit TsaD [Rikenellaceae bacterium]